MKPGLTVAMIVRDERENLEHLLPVLTAGADDVVVVDTGSTDGTMDTARSLGARVFETRWTNDFACARNRGLDEVLTSHVMWIDADDRLDVADLARVRERALERGRAGLMLLLVNASHDTGATSSSWQLRVFPNRPEHRFRGRIHEQLQTALEATGTPIERFDVTIRHEGYLDPAEVVRKARRNLDLLRRELAEGSENDVNVLYHLMKAATACGELELARGTARRVVETPPERTPMDIIQAAAVQWARIEYQRGQRSEAERILRDATQRVPDDAVARFFLGDLLRRGGELAGAEREFSVASASPIRNTNLPLPVAGLRRAILWNWAEVLEMLGHPERAEPLYRQILAERPDDDAARVAAARAAIACDHLEEAEHDLARLASSAAAEAEVVLLRATVAFNRERDDESRALFELARARMPRHWAIPLHLGHLALRNRDTTAARTHYETALRLGDHPEIRVGLAAVELENGRPAEALEELARVADACATRPVPPGTHALAGETLLRLGRPSEARGAFERHLSIHGPDARVLARLADCYRELGVTDAARLGYTRALTMSPGLAEAVRGLESLATR